MTPHRRPTIHRFTDTAELFSALSSAVERVVDPGELVAMPTGRTPLTLYRRMRQNPGSVALWKTFHYLQLDEYLNAPPGTQLFREYLQQEIFDPLEVPETQRFTIPAHLPAEQAGRHMDKHLRRHGPLAVALLGLGHNGHIAFNEPAPSFASGYHTVRLTPRTVQNNFPDQPDLEVDAITISVEQLLNARHVMLVATQPDKQAILDRVLAGPVDPQVPASALVEHPRLEVYRIS